MRKITGTVDETLTISKTVVIEVPDNATPGEIRNAVEAEAYKVRFTDSIGVHGWEGVITDTIAVSYREEDASE